MSRPTKQQQQLRKFLATLPSQPTKKVIDRVKKGDDVATQALVLAGPQLSKGGYLLKLIRAGLVDAVLHFLQTALDQSFEEVLTPTKGDLFSPSVWTNLLMNMTARRQLPNKEANAVRVKIARNIGPLIEAMTEMDSRLFFQSRKHWLKNLLFFTGLIENLVLSAVTVPILVRYGEESVRTFIVQAMFFNVYRQDIKEEFVSLGQMVLPDCLGTVEASAIAALQEFVDIPAEKEDESCIYFSEENKAILNRIGNLPAVHPGYEYNTPDKRAPNDATLARCILEVAQNPSNKTFDRSFDSLFWVFSRLQVSMPKGSFGEGLAGKLVKIGKEKSWKDKRPHHWSNFHFKNADQIFTALNSYVVRPVNSPLAPIGQAAPVDKTMAAAIDAGMIEWIGDMLSSASCVPRRPFNEDGPMAYLLTCIVNTLEGACAVALERRTNSVIIEKAASIREAVEQIPKKCAYSSHEINKSRDLIHALLDKAASCHHDTDDVVCRRCLSNMSDYKTCSKCLRATYCSRECQVSDWPRHKKECKFMRTNEAKARKQGMDKKDRQAAADAEKNLSISGNRLFHGNKAEILLQASLRGYSILDCVVVMDFTESRPTIETKNYGKFLEENRKEADDPEQVAHTEGVVDRNRKNGSVTAICFAYNTQHGHGEGLLKTYPGDSVGWLRRQKQVEELFCPELNELMQDSKRRKERIETLMRPDSIHDEHEQNHSQQVDDATVKKLLELMTKPDAIAD